MSLGDWFRAITCQKPMPWKQAELQRQATEELKREYERLLKELEKK